MVSRVKIRMNVYLNGKQKKSLERLSAKTGAPVAELIRRAIDAYLVSRKKELKMKKRAAIYCRVSTADQHPETQLYDLREMGQAAWI